MQETELKQQKKLEIEAHGRKPQRDWHKLEISGTVWKFLQKGVTEIGNLEKIYLSEEEIYHFVPIESGLLSLKR